MELFGRRTIYTDELNITDENILKVLRQAVIDHSKNRNEIEYLYNYYRGKQDILERVKEVREEINNRVVVNRANEIVAFKTAYLVGEPVQYISRSNDADNDSVARFNDFMSLANKSGIDEKVMTWAHICGIGYLMVMPNNNRKEWESPFKLTALDPRRTFVVRSSDLDNEILLGVTYITRKDGTNVYYCYTKDSYYKVVGDASIFAKENHILGNVPIIEYCHNDAKLGAFEIVIDLLNGINLTESDRVNGVEQFVQALMMFKGVDIETEDYKALKDEGAICVPTDGDIEYLIQELNQTQTQTLIDDMYDAILTICGMPNRNGGNSTSDTGSAVVLRDGWYSAEGRAKTTENMYKIADSVTQELAIGIANTYAGLNLNVGSIEPKFTRRNYENILQKSQVLTTMLNNDKIHPKLAFIYSNMFPDPEDAYQMSKQYKEQNIKIAEEMFGNGDNNATDNPTIPNEV